MKEVITALRALQDVDQHRIDAEKERQSITERVQSLVARVAELEREQSEKRDKLREAEKWYLERDRELKEDNEKIRRAQMRLNALNKQKEHAAVQREIESLRHGNQLREEEILKLQAVMSEFKAAVDEEEKLLEEMREDLSREQESAVERVRELDGRIANLGSSYKDYEANIPADPQALQEDPEGLAWHGGRTGRHQGQLRRMPQTPAPAAVQYPAAQRRAPHLPVLQPFRVRGNQGSRRRIVHACEPDSFSREPASV